MYRKKLVITGSSGLIGSEVCSYFAGLGWSIIGIDSNARRAFFGPAGDTISNLHRLQANLQDSYLHHNLDIRDRTKVLELIEQVKPDAIVHAAAQPSHDLAARIPFDDFDTNAVGTLNMLEAVRRSAPDAPFVHMSTNKVYGDAPNEIPLKELETRWDYERVEHFKGIDENCRIDQSKHSLFGASKVAADVLVQEYGRYFGMKTCCLRAGCMTGPNHAGVELHGFLSYLIKANLLAMPYTIYGYKGKQVRDNIHAYDVATFIDFFIQQPRCAEVYNLGGGRENSISVLEAIDKIQVLSGKQTNFTYDDQARAGDHICYISNLEKLRKHYPDWRLSKTLDDIFEEIYRAWLQHPAVNQPTA